MARRAFALVLLMAALGPDVASAAESVTVGTAAEAWYDMLSPCAAVGGCPATPPRRYPAGTLHVGVTLGREDSRTYVALDLAELPAGAAVRSGRLTLPVAGPGAGTSNPDAARIVVCLATTPVTDEDGSTEPPPAPDCGTRSPANLGGGSFTVDLTPFGARIDEGLAILASPEALTPSTNWHVAFNSRTSEGGRITARLAYEAAGPPDAAAPQPIVDEPVSEIPVLGAPVAPTQPLPAEVAAEPEVGALSTASVTQSREPPTAAGRFTYPGVFWLPLIMLAGCGYLAYGLTQPVHIQRTRPEEE